MTIPESTRALDVYDVAVLAGGFPRLVDTALVALVESGRIRIEPSGEFHAAVPTSPHPVEAAVLDAVGSRGYRSAESVCWRLERDQRLDQEFQHLTADGLLRHGLPFGLGRRTHPHPTAAGRRALQEFAERPPADAGSAVPVALHGRGAMPDARLRDEIFEPRPVVLAPRSARRPSREMHPGDLGRRAYLGGGAAAAMGFGGPGMGDSGDAGGGGGGGDGG
ncbi:TIGR04222 domain-containing membrane protein [Blastococcus sp. SYSU D01042]